MNYLTALAYCIAESDLSKQTKLTLYSLLVEMHGVVAAAGTERSDRILGRLDDKVTIKVGEQDDSPG